MKRLVILASGSGTNAENLIRYFRKSNIAEVVMVLTNNRKAKVLDRCRQLSVSAFFFNEFAFTKTNDVINLLVATKPDLVILAGFLWKIPKSILEQFPNKIINIHPSLLPKFGGKGMYGEKVHQAVLKSKEKETGITIHYINEYYDEGNIIFQKSCEISSVTSAIEIAIKVNQLEMEYFPKVIENLLK